MDWIIRITFLVIVIISAIINIMRIHNGLEKIWYLETYVVLFVFIIVTEAARALMERRYAENRNDYKFTIVRLMFISTLLILTFTTNFFGLV
jgi:heme O synthase-like polyprenyltransferase